MIEWSVSRQPFVHRRLTSRQQLNAVDAQDRFRFLLFADARSARRRLRADHRRVRPRGRIQQDVLRAVRYQVIVQILSSLKWAPALPATFADRLWRLDDQVQQLA